MRLILKKKNLPPWLVENDQKKDSFLNPEDGECFKATTLNSF